VQKRSLILSVIVITVAIAIVIIAARRNANIGTSVEASHQSSDAVASESTSEAIQPGVLSDDSAEVTTTLPYFHRLDANYTRGAEPASGGIETIKRLGIKTIVDLRSNYDHTEALGIAAQQSGLQYRRVPMSVWNPPTDKEAKAFVDLVTDKSQGPFYVFCADGLNRIGEMSAIYRVAESKWSVKDALHEADKFGFNPYYYNLRAYVFTYARKYHPNALPKQARSLSSMEM
jgi:protein tyrosine/serine phosphatase